MQDRFFSAVRSGDLAMIRSLVENHNFDPHTRNLSGLTAMHIAAKVGRIDIMNYLYSRGLLYNVEDARGYNPLWHAITNNQITVENYLKEKFENADTQPNSIGNSFSSLTPPGSLGA